MPHAKLNADDIEELMEIFKQYDTGELGFIKIADIYAVLLKFGLHPTEAEFIEFLTEARPSGPMKPICFKAFCHMVGFLLKPKVDHEKLTLAFDVFDTDRDGVINSQELKTIAASSGMDISLKEASQMISECSNGKSFLTMDEFFEIIYSER